MLQADSQRYKAKIEDLEKELAVKGQVKKYFTTIGISDAKFIHSDLQLRNQYLVWYLSC